MGKLLGQPCRIRPLPFLAILVVVVLLQSPWFAVAHEGTTVPTEDRAAEIGKISGQVVFDKDGVLAQAAKVFLLAPPPKGKKNYPGTLPLQEMIADAEGRFTFASLPAGKYRVWANLGKLTSRQKQRKGAEVEITEDNPAPPSVELRLIDGVTIVARIKDKATGELVPDATVHPTWGDFKADFHASGKAPVIVQPLTREFWRLEVWGKGFAKQSRSFNLEDGNDVEMDFELIPGANLTGVVRDPEGNPVEGIGLGVSIEHESEQLGYAQTDKDGRYKLDRIPRHRDLRLHVSKVDWIEQTHTIRLTDVEQTRDLTVNPRPHGGTIEGTIVDQSGKPIENAEVTNVGRSSNYIRKAKSDANGRYKLDNLFQGLSGCEVVVRASKFAPRRMTVEPGPKDSPTQIDFEMEPGYRVKGKVIDEAGRGLDGVMIVFANGNDPFNSIGGRGKSDQNGRFEFDSLPADCPFMFYKKDYSTINDLKLELNTDQELIVEMVSMGLILGKVVDQATGKPIQKFNVRITFSPIQRPDDPRGSLTTEWIRPGRMFKSDTGSFRLADLIVGIPLQVMIDAEGYETAIEKRVEAAGSGNASELAFELVPIDPKSLRKYSGQLLDADQAPMSEVQVRLIMARNRNQLQRAMHPFNWDMIQNGQLADAADVARFLSTITDKEGRFEFRNVPRDMDTELAWWGSKVVQGRLDHIETWSENEAIEIVLPKPARIKGKIDLKSYAKVGYIQVHSREERLGYVQIELKPEQNEFEINNLAAGSYDITLMTPYEPAPGNNGGLTNHRLGSLNITLGEGDVQDVEFSGN